MITEIERKIERNKANGWKDLKAKDKAFCLEYIISYNVTEAAELSKNSGNGPKLLRNPIIVAHIIFLQEEHTVGNFITEDFIRTQYLNLLPMLSGQVDVPMVTAKGDCYTGKKFFASEYIAVLKDLRKSVDGYNGEKLDVNMSLSDAFYKAMMGEE